MTYVIRNVKFIKVMQFKQMFVTAVCVLFLVTDEANVNVSLQNRARSTNTREGEGSLRAVPRRTREVEMIICLARPFFLSCFSRAFIRDKNITRALISFILQWSRVSCFVLALESCVSRS